MTEPTTMDELLEQMTESDFMLQFRAARAAVAPYCEDHMAALFEPERPSAPLPAPKATVRGHNIVRWKIYQANFIELIESLMGCEDTKRWAVTRAAEQVTGFTADGSEIVLTEDDVRKLPVVVGKAMVRLVPLLGDVPSKGKPEVIKQGDAVSKPIVLRLGTPVNDVDTLAFKVRTVGELEELAAVGGGLLERVYTLMSLCDDPEVVESMAPADGWALLKHVLEPATKTAKKTMKGVRSYEFALKMPFAASTPLGVVMSRQEDYGRLFKQKADAQKAAQNKAKQRGGKKRR